MSLPSQGSPPSRPEFDPFLPEFARDPYPLYARLCRENPIHYCSLGFWVVSSYDGVTRVLRDPHFCSTPSALRLLAGRPERQSPTDRIKQGLLSYMDPPGHTKLRALVRRAFGPRHIEAMQPRILQLAQDLVRQVEVRAEIDLIADLARPLAVTTIAEMLGIAPEDRARLAEWSRWIFFIFDPLLSGEKQRRLDQAIVECRDFMASLIRGRRAHPQADVLGALLQAEDGERRISDNDLVAICLFMVASSSEGMVNFLGNAFLALLDFPDELAKLREDPALIPSAVEELLRFVGPSQFSARTASQDLEVGGQRIRKGEVVLLLKAAANRDPARFAQPDRLDITRADNPHVAFGGGIHHCMGAPLARLEAQILIRTVTQRLPGLARTERPLEWKSILAARGLESLFVTSGVGTPKSSGGNNSHER